MYSINGDKNKYNKLFVRITLGMSAFLLSVQLFCLSAFAVNLDYLDESKWENNPNITVVEINKTSVGNSLSGIFEYYIDNSNMCIYTCFHISESSLDNDNNDARISYAFYMPNERYVFSVNRNGMCDPPEAEKELFEVNQNFYSVNRNGTFISAVEYLGSDKECSIDIALYVNGHRYIIQKGINMKIPETTRLSTTKATTIAKTAVTKTTNERTTTEKTEKTTTEKSTKYAPKYTGNIKYSTSGKADISESENYEQTEEFVTSNYEMQEEEKSEPKVQLSKSSKLMLKAGTAVAALGTIILASAVIIRARKPKENITEK